MTLIIPGETLVLLTFFNGIPLPGRHKKMTLPLKIYSCKSRKHLLSTILKIGTLLAYYIS